jgi:hypothetical protein
MSKAFGTFQKLARKSNEHKQGHAAREDENLIRTSDALASAQHGSGEARQRSVLQLQRIIGNKAVGKIVSQNKQGAASVQREIEMEATGLPKLSTYFNDAFASIAAMVDADMFPRFKAKLAADHPMKEKAFLQAWALKTMRPTLLEYAQEEFSPENINFLLAVEAYKESPSVDKAMQIYTEFINEAAATQVNLSAAVRLRYDAAHATFTAAPPTRARS